jgi:microcystin-dependent protein
MSNNTKNLANGTVLTAPSPATSGTTLVLDSGYGSAMPAVPFFLTLTPPGQLSTMGNSEVVLVTARSTDTLTIVRAMKSTTARSIASGWVVSNSIYVETSTQVGDIMTTLNATPRAGRLFMDGGTYTKANYPLMYQYVVDNPAYGTYTTTSGSESFTLKDMRNRMQIAKGPSGTFSTLGATGGAEMHTNTVTEMANHSHVLDGFAHANGSGYTHLAGGGSWNFANMNTQTMSYTGGGAAWSIMNPYVVVNYEVIAE